MSNKEIYELAMEQPTRELAIQKLKELKINKTGLISLCKENCVYFRGSANKDELITNFVYSTLGSKLIHDAIRNCDLRPRY